jgi:hypothetical protein
MMSSVIPARLEFQCGHAALVSLPRVKGESSAQRNDRIAREKSAAQSRSCDFCPPMAVAEVAEAVVVVAALATPPVPVVALPVPVVVLPEPVVALREPVVALPLPAVAATSANPTPTTKRAARPRRQRPVPAAQPAALNGRGTSYRFFVRFRTEAVLEATDIRDALRQAESLGATELLALQSVSA